MKTYAPFLLLALVGCAGQNSSMNNQSTGLYTNQARDDRERQDLVALAAKELGKGAGAKATAAMNDFGFRLLRLEGEKNAMISPFSISTALSMTLNGAENETAKGMAAALGADKLTVRQINEASASFRDLLGGADPSVELKVANAIWHQPSFTVDPTFKQATSEFYGAKVDQLDFSQEVAKDSVNEWAKTATNGKIPVVVDELPKDLRMLLANAVYFKGDWKTPFSANSTTQGDFRIADQDVMKKVSFMRGKESLYAEAEGAKILRKPYGNGTYEMVFVLPPADLNAYLKDLDGAKWLKLVNAKTSEAAVFVPKWKSSAKFDLKKPLIELGMARAFEAGKAQFGKLGKDASGNGVFISKVSHSTFLEVDEKGSEAAAVTTVEMAPTSMPAEPPKEFKLDRPFIFAIREAKTGLILFLGRVDDPTK